MAHETHASLKRRGQSDHESKLKSHMASGGDVAQDKKLVRKAIMAHENHDHAGKPHTKLGFKDGGAVDGEAKKHRLDRAAHARGGSAKPKEHGNHVNVIVAGGGPKPMPVPVPGGPMPGPAAGMAPPPMAPRPPMGPVGPGPAASPMGGPPGLMRKAGGRVEVSAGNNGLGRMEKAKEYGTKMAKAGENKGVSGDVEDEAFTGDAENKPLKKGGKA